MISLGIRSQRVCRTFPNCGRLSFAKTFLVLFAFLPIYPQNFGQLQLVEFEEKEYKMKILARNFIQGEVLLVRIYPNEKGWNSKDFSVYADSNPIALHRQEGEILGFVPIHPERSPKPLEIEVHLKRFFSGSLVRKHELEIGSADFPVIQKQSIRISKKYTHGTVNPETLKYIQECREERAKALETDSKLQFREGFLAPVMVISISSPFYVRRDYNKIKGKPHSGIDFRGKQGTPIYAINSGTVVLARDMFYEGKFTIIDHGQRVFSLYMHQSKILVEKGQKVSRGEKIGEIGSTGMSTGPHLHLGVVVNGTLVNPLSILAFQEI